MGFFGSRSSSEQSKDSNRERQRETSKYTKVSKRAKDKVKSDKAKDNASAFRDMEYSGSKAPSILAKVSDAIGLSKKSFDVNKAYYEKNIVGKNNFTASPDDFKKYMTSRGSGKVDAMGRAINTPDGGSNNPQGIELAKSATGSATVKGPEEIQKTAANTKGTTDTIMTAAQINIANKRKGKKVTNQTAKTVLTEDYKLSKKKLLG